MRQNAKQIFFISTIALVGFFYFWNLEFDNNTSVALVSNAKTISEVLKKRENYINNVKGRNVDKIVNILIVPGHDDENWGAQFRGIKEVELNRALSQKLYEYLLNEEGINPVLVSNEYGYNFIFETYFKREQKKIAKFIEDSKNSFSKKVSEEEFDQVENNFHNVAPDEVRQKLYGINQWADTQKFDLVIHVHFNDYGGRKKNRIGKYDGFSIYTPGEFFKNYKLSRTLADSVFAELKKIRPISNLKEEQEGVIEDHELIALGANESLGAGSILIEYGYIYESIFIDPATRETSLDYFAYATYSGIKKMLNETPKEKEKIEVAISKDKTSKNNIVWQFQKTLEGKYPPDQKNLRDCPINGYFGECSKDVQ